MNTEIPMSKFDISEITNCDELIEAILKCGWTARNDAQHEKIKAVWARIVHLPAAPVVLKGAKK